MKTIVKQSDRRAAFTIVELLTVMSVIIILIGLLVPGLNALKKYARKVTQRNQFHAIKNQLEAFNAEWGDYPKSDPATAGRFSGATALAVAMVGEDFLGYDRNGIYDTTDLSNRSLYLQPERGNAYRLKSVFPVLGPPDACEPVLCDVYTNVEDYYTGKLIGMPVLYYRANRAKIGTDIYAFADNQPIAGLGKPWQGGAPHAWFDPASFAGLIQNESVDVTYRPNNADSYILISAGHDGEYGTADDLFNF
ncbi:MAG: type II secretion system protein [Planctomycetota bacterium]